MKNGVKLGGGIFPLVTVCILCSCSLFTGADIEAMRFDSVVFGQPRLTVAVGSSEYLPLTLQPSDQQKDAQVEWDYDSAFVTVDPDTYGAVITGTAPGETYVKASASGIVATCIITVVPAEEAVPEAEPYIYSIFSVLQLTPGSTQTISVSLYAGSSDDLEDFTWTVGDPDIADLSASRNNAVIHTKATGSTQIIAAHPKCAYQYSIILYVYTEALTEAYLTTENNVVTINQTEEASKTVSVSVQNPAGAIDPSAFTWEIIPSENGPACITMSSTGSTAILSPRGNGISLVRITYKDCKYPLDILVRVSRIVQNVYIEPSATTLVVEGSDAVHNIYANIAGYSGFANPDEFAWTVEDETAAGALLSWDTAGNTFSLTGKKNGVVKVKVSHPLAEYGRTILIILRNQRGSAIDASMYITTTSNYVQTKIGAEPTNITVSLVGGLPGDEQDFIWKIDNGANNDIARIETTTGSVLSRAMGSYAYGNLWINPLKTGTATVTVHHPKILYETDIIIKVYSEYALLEEPAYVNGESVVKMLNGSTREVTVSLTGKYGQGDENGIVWQSDPSRVSVSPSQGPTVVFAAHAQGNSQSYVSAGHPKALSEKRILVLSADTPAALDAMKGIYADTTYVRINENGTGELALREFGLSSADINSIVWTVDKPAVCTVQAHGGDRLTATVSGAGSGTAVVTASLAGCAPCTFYITVLPEGEETGLILPAYLTTERNALVIETPGQTASVTVNGINISDADMATRTVWQSENTGVATVHASGASATITAVNSGRTRITVSNHYAANALVIDVKVGSVYEWNDDPLIYITTESDVVTLVKGTQKTIAASLVNAQNNNNFSFRVSGGGANITLTGSANGTALIEAREAGIAEITIANSQAAAEKQIMVLVSNTPEELAGFLYMTTRQNVITVGENSTATVQVAIPHTDIPVLSGYTWVSDNPAAVEVAGSGQTAVFYGKKQGTAKITVRNDRCSWPLEIIANCVNLVQAAKDPYIISPSIVTVTVGGSPKTITADLIGGSPADYNSFSFAMDNELIAEVHGASETAQITAVKAGVAALKISHPRAKVYRTVLVIAEPKPETDCYINTSESIIRIAPTDGARTITATLINGEPNDVYNFKWWADSYDILEMNYTTNQAIIKPVGAGTVTLHVSHPKAQQQKDIIVYISQYSEFAFEKTAATVTAGVQTFVNLQVPAMGFRTRISYSVDKPSIVGASGTSSVCVLDPHAAGSAVVTAHLVAESSGTIQAKAELLVTVQPQNVQNPYITYTGASVITVEKGVTKTLSASVSGPGTVSADANSLRWTSSNASLVLTPKYSNNVAVGSQIQITPGTAGIEGTVTISHEPIGGKPVNSITLYIIVPAEDSANITLNNTYIELNPGATSTISATVKNPVGSDQNNITWTSSDAGKVKIVTNPATGRTVQIQGVAVGRALITATVPSSGRTAACTVEVVYPRLLTLSPAILTTFPGDSQKTVSYTVSPAGDTVSFTSDRNTVVFSSSSGKLYISPTNNQGTAVITGKTSSGATASVTVINSYNNHFSLSKSSIKAAPSDTAAGLWTVQYEVSPANAEIRIEGLTSGSAWEPVRVTPGSITAGYVLIPASNHASNIDPATGIARGSFTFQPDGEFCHEKIKVKAVNTGYRNAAGLESTQEIGAREINLQVMYNSYTYTITKVSSVGYSKYDPVTQTFIISDGGNIVFDIRIAEPKANQTFTEDFKPRSPPLKQPMDIGGIGWKPTFTITKTVSGKRVTLAASPPVTASPANPNVLKLFLAGDFIISHPRTDNKKPDFTYTYPVYLEVRGD
jgi:hypothetical protein